MERLLSNIVSGRFPVKSRTKLSGFLPGSHSLRKSSGTPAD